MPSLTVSDLFEVAPRTWILCLLGLICLRVLVSEARQWYRLRHIPGPFICGFTRFWHFRKFLSCRIHETYNELVTKYGPVVRIGPNQLLCSDPEALRKIMAVRSEYTKSDWYVAGRLDPNHESMISITDAELRKERRAKLVHGFSIKNNDAFEAGIDEAMSALTQLIDSKYLSTDTDFRPVELGQKIQYLGLDVIGEVAFGHQFGYLVNDRDLHDVLKINKATLPILGAACVYQELVRLLFKWPLRYLLPRDGDKTGLGAVMGFTTLVLNEWFQSETKTKPDMVQSFVDHGLTRDELKQDLTLLIIAGADTTASLIQNVILYLIANPRMCRKLQAELDHVTPPMRYSTTRNLPYLQAVIREVLRLAPPAGPNIFYKLVPAGGDVLAGYPVPGGTEVATCPGLYPMGRSKEIWGADAEQFRPERWLEADASRVHSMVAAVELNFGGGQYQCIGRGLALMEVNKAIAELVRRYDFFLANPVKPAKLMACLVFSLHDFWVGITKRET